MTYDVVDIQNISVATITGEQISLLVIKVEYEDESFKYTRIFELNPSATDEEITTLIVDEGQRLKADPNKREINISGVI
jgi:hypothetical protein